MAGCGAACAGLDECAGMTGEGIACIGCPPDCRKEGCAECAGVGPAIACIGWDPEWESAGPCGECVPAI